MKKIIFFDDSCLMCNKFVRHIIKYDIHEIYQFASIESEAYLTLLNSHSTSVKNIKSAILFENNNIKIKSSVVISVFKDLSWVHKILSNIILLVPRFIRDKCYDFIAINRHYFFKFNKKVVCYLHIKRILK